MSSLHFSSRLPIFPTPLSASHRSRYQILLFFDGSLEEKKLFTSKFSPGNPTASKTPVFSSRLAGRIGDWLNFTDMRSKIRFCAETDVELLDSFEKDDSFAPVGEEKMVLAAVGDDSELGNEERNGVGSLADGYAKTSKVEDLNLVSETCYMATKEQNVIDDSVKETVIEGCELVDHEKNCVDTSVDEPGEVCKKEAFELVAECDALRAYQVPAKEQNILGNFDNEKVRDGLELHNKEDCGVSNSILEYSEAMQEEASLVVSGNGALTAYQVPVEKQDGLDGFVKGNGALRIKRVDRLQPIDFVKRVINLPIEDRVKVLDLFESDEKVLTISDYNDILTALVKGGEHDTAISLFDELPSRGVKPDSWSFSIMIRCFCKKNQPEAAKRILDDMVGSGFYPNAATFTALVNCFCKRGKLKVAFEVFEIMKEAECEPTVRIYNSLISGLCFVGRLEEAFQLLKKIKRSSKVPDIYTYTLVIDGFCKVGRSDEAMELLNEAQEMGIAPNIVTFNALLNGYCKEGRPLDALHVLKDMQKGACPPDFISYSTVLQGLLRWREVSAAWLTYRKMRDAGFTADEQALNTLLRCLCRQPVINAKVLKDGKELFQMIMEMGTGPSPYTYCLMVQALCKGGETDQAMFHLHEMVRMGYSPRMMTYNMIMRTLCAEGRVHDAVSILDLMVESGVIPNAFSFSILLSELNRRGRILDAFGLYAAAIKRGVVPQWKPKLRFKRQKVR